MLKRIDFYVLDASIVGAIEWDEFLREIPSKSKIVLTSITLKELEKLQKYNDTKGFYARRILALAIEKEERFTIELISEKEAPDDAIINYCFANKENAILVSADKTMILKARMYGIKNKYIQQSGNNKFKNFYPKLLNKRDKTLYIAKQINDKLCIVDFNNDYRNIMVVSGQYEYTGGVIYELKIGDNVYICTNKGEYLTFAHYKITALTRENNCMLINHKRIYGKKDFEELPRKAYRNFIRDSLLRNENCYLRHIIF